MTSGRLRNAVEHAWYLRLEGLPWRVAAVQCGVDALSEGLDGAEVARLAGADDAEDDELTRVFHAAVRQIGVELPAPVDERAWRIRRTEDLEREGRVLRPRTPERVFEDRLYLVGRRLSEIGGTPETSAFLRHLDTPGDDYDRWLRELDERARRVADVEPGPVGRIVRALADVVQGIAYSATTPADLDRASGLLAAVDAL